MRRRVFVYGTLRRGHENHAQLASARFVGLARTLPEWTRVAVGPYPGLRRDGSEVIEGEVYEVSPALLAELDRFEDVPRLYRRETLRLEDDRDAEVYVAAQSEPSIAREAESFFRSRFRERGDAERAVREKAYMKSELAFHGVAMDDVKRAARDFDAAHPRLDAPALRAIAEHLFASGFFDLRSAALALLERRRRVLGPSDLGWLIELARAAAAWAHVDWLATKVIGAIRKAHPETQRVLDAWARDEDLWVRRTALLTPLDELRAGRGDFAEWSAHAESMLDDRSFWIRKAIGWVLRDVSKKRPELTASFLREHGARCSGLTMREAKKHLPAELLATISAAPSGRRAGTPG